MHFQPTPLAGSFIITLDVKPDDRGFFARTFCQQEFIEHGLKPVVAQCNLSFNHKAGTLRGMHFQIPPASETKLVRCTRGRIYDVIVDLRPDSPTYLRHYGVELSADNRAALYVPELFAHGYQTLTDDAEVSYQVSQAYTPGCERGIRFNDPALELSWPRPVTVISPKDANWPDFERETASAVALRMGGSSERSGK